MSQPPTTESRAASMPAVVRGLIVIALLYLFLGGVKLLETGIPNMESISRVPPTGPSCRRIAMRSAV